MNERALELDAPVGSAPRALIRGWRTGGARSAFWIIAALGTLLLSAAWFWYGLAFNEEMTEQGKAAATGGTMAGTGLVMGGIPVVVAHLLLLVALAAIGVKSHSRRSVGILLALGAVAMASAVGIAVNEVVWEGKLFTMYADAPVEFIP